MPERLPTRVSRLPLRPSPQRRLLPPLSRPPEARSKARAGVVLDIQVAVGDRVGTGQRLMILEAMKMENNIDSDREGTVKEIKVATGDSVLEGDVLLTIE